MRVKPIVRNAHGRPAIAPELPTTTRRALDRLAVGKQVDDRIPWRLETPPPSHLPH